MPELVWYRSLYWRAALGFVGVLAATLLVQGLIFLWMTGRMADLFPSRSPAQLAVSIATDVAAVLAEAPETDLDGYLTSHYSSRYRSYVLALTDGRSFTSKSVPPNPVLLRAAWGRLFGERAGGGPPDFRGRGRGDRGPGGRGSFGRGGDGRAVPADRPQAEADPGRRDSAPQGAAGSAERVPGGSGDRTRFGRGGLVDGGFRGGPPGNIEFATVITDGVVKGVVAVPQEPPPIAMALRDLGPTLGAVASVLLVMGTAAAALVVFRPTRRRLQELQMAARALGHGEAGVRAPETGADEVTALSKAFNEMADQLEARTSALAQADRTRRQLLADVSHELSTPLSAIRGYVETLAMPDLNLDPAARQRYLGIVNEEAGRLEHIIGDLLDLAKLEDGGSPFRSESVSIAHLLERVSHRHGPAVAEKRIALTTHLAPDMPDLRGDRNRLEQALQNLVANAVRHTPDGGAVTVEAVDAGDCVILRVDDTGPGIPPEHLPYLFDRFYKVDQSRTGTDLPSGSGLGLSIVRAIVERQEGRVAASNLPGGGARFEISLPKPPAS